MSVNIKTRSVRVVAIPSGVASAAPASSASDGLRPAQVEAGAQALEGVARRPRLDRRLVRLAQGAVRIGRSMRARATSNGASSAGPSPDRLAQTRGGRAGISLGQRHGPTR